MSRPPRDRQAERNAIHAAAARLLAGTPLRSAAGALSATTLATESGLPRWKLYDHGDLLGDFQSRVHAQGAVPEAQMSLGATNERLVAELANTTAELSAERARTALLRRALTEATIELEQAREQVVGDATVTHLPVARRRSTRPPGSGP